MKFYYIALKNICAVSPSPRRAWIEITGYEETRKYIRVALPTEGVD